MIYPRQNEPRIEYLARVLHRLMETNASAAECTVEYDGTECDGYCLAEDIVNELGVEV